MATSPMTGLAVVVVGYAVVMSFRPRRHPELSPPGVPVERFQLQKQARMGWKAVIGAPILMLAVGALSATEAGSLNAAILETTLYGAFGLFAARAVWFADHEMQDPMNYRLELNPDGIVVRYILWQRDFIPWSQIMSIEAKGLRKRFGFRGAAAEFHVHRAPSGDRRLFVQDGDRFAASCASWLARSRTSTPIASPATAT